MGCLCGNSVKQGTNFYLPVEFSFGDYANLDNVDKIEFIFKQKNESSAPVIKSSLYLKDGTGDSHRRPDTNIVLVPFSVYDTYSFEHNHKFYMDTKVYFTGSEENPPTNIVELTMSNTLFDSGDIPEPEVIPLEVTENGTYTAPFGRSFNPVTVNVTISFGNITDPPYYNGEPMTSETDIPEITESTVSSWGFTKNVGTYVKPSSGIPESDLSADVQAKLNSSGGASDFDDLNDRPKYNGMEMTSETDIPEVPTNTSDLVNDSGFITSSDIPTIPTKTSDLQNDSGFITSSDIPTKTSDLQNDSGFITSSDIPEVPTQLSQLSGDSTHRVVTDAEKFSWNAKSDFSGDYEDLTNKPTIPSAVTESTVAEWGFTKNTGTYVKPSDGIPSSDLSSSVQTSLGKADTAVQPSDISDMATETWVEAKRYITEEDLPAIPTKTSDLTNDSGFITASGVPKEIFEVTYGTTTFAEITNALSNGLFPVCVYNDKVYTYTGLSNGYHCLSCVLTTNVYRLYIKSSWGSAQMSVYQKPSTGIPYADLSNDVQEALLPTVTSADNGKFLRVSNGAWAAVTIPSPIGEEY